MKIEYNNSEKAFSVYQGDRLRVIFDNLNVKLRLTSVSLKSGRIKPLETQNEKGVANFPLIQSIVGSEVIYGIQTPSANLSAEIIDDSLMLSYKCLSEELFSPDEAVALSIGKLPGVDGAVFYHNRSDEFRNFDCEGLWWSQAVFVKDPSTDITNDWGMLALWRYEDGKIGGILPLTTDKVLGRLRGSESGLEAISSTTVAGKHSDYPLVLISFADSPEEVIDNLYGSYRKIYPNIPLRENKKIGKPFDKLGWCTWNAFGKDCNENNIINAVEIFNEKNIPIKYIIVDDSWQDIEDTNSEKLKQGITGAALLGIGADVAKYPSGIESMISKCRQAGIEAVGLWHALNGYWQGISENSPLYKQHPDWFIKAINGKIMPKPNTEFFDDWYKQLKEWGVDFVKIDNAGFHRQHLSYQESLCGYMAALQQDIKRAATANDFRIIYCMSSHPENVYNSLGEQVLRITNDFIPNDVYGTTKHIINNFYNSIWLGKLQWTDFDMFQSSDKNAIAFAHSLAISQSPIYTTDEPKNLNATLIRRLAFADGSVPKYDTPCYPVKSRFFDNPFADGNVLAVRADTRFATTIGLFNVTGSDKQINGTISLKELGLEEQNYFVYSDSGRFEPFIIDKGGFIEYTLDSLKSDLITLAPVIDGFAVIGVTDYYAAPACVLSGEKDVNALSLRLKNAGNILIYCQEKPTKVRGGKIELENADNITGINQFVWNKGILKIHTNIKDINIEF